MSSNSGGTWAAASGAARSLLVDDGTSCQPDIDTIPKPNPDPNAELGDMYAKPGGTNFQTLSATNNGVRGAHDSPLASFSGQSPRTPRACSSSSRDEPGGPEGSPFTTAKTLGSGGGGVILMYIACAPPLTERPTACIRPRSR